MDTQILLRYIIYFNSLVFKTKLPKRKCSNECDDMIRGYIRVYCDSSYFVILLFYCVIFLVVSGNLVKRSISSCGAGRAHLLHLPSEYKPPVFM